MKFFLKCLYFIWIVISFIYSTHLNDFLHSQFPNFNLNQSKFRFNRMVLDVRTKFIYVSAVNWILQLDENLRVLNRIQTGPLNDSHLCHASGCDSVRQSHDDPNNKRPFISTLMDNYNKILLIDYENNRLIGCGSLLQGSCTKYQLDNITLNPEFIPVAIAANDPNSSTFAFIGPKRYNNWDTSNVMYVGTTFTNNGEYRHDVPAISTRNLDNLMYAENYLKQSFLQVEVIYRDHFLVQYIYGFNNSEYAYFVIVQKQSHLPGQEEQGYITRLARICVNDANYDSYIEITLECSKNNLNYNLVQDAKLFIKQNDDEIIERTSSMHFDNPVLIATFRPSVGITNEPSNKSAVCVYSMDEIETKFNENIHFCFNGSVPFRNMEYISGQVNHGKCANSKSFGNIVNFCDAGLKINGNLPISKQAVLTYDNFPSSAVFLTSTTNHLVMFLGSAYGDIKKVLLSSPVPIEYEQFTVDKGSAILPDSFVSSKNQFVYILSTSKNCSRYNNCLDCLNSKDPYCGWCSLEKKCTVKSVCQKASHNSPRWLSLSGGQQCIDFERIQPDHMPIDEDAVNLSLFIRTLPDLPFGAKYKCIFGSNTKPIDATVTDYGLTCAVPNFSERPKISDSKDHTLISLSVRSSETNKDFVSRSFAFYDCSKHVTCSQCVKSKWACNWCVYENKCLYNYHKMCQKPIISGENSQNILPNHGRNSCPKFHKSHTSYLIPNEVPKELKFEIENLPLPLPGDSGFKCIVSIEGAKMLIPARVESNRYVICDRTTYSYKKNIGEYEANIEVVWNQSNHIDDMNITLYKCNILGSYRDHADCSLCITRNSKYKCVWCDKSCTYNETCYHTIQLKCPKPRIDSIRPLSGPIEGGTLLTIEGSNLGFKKQDVFDKIFIGKVPCRLESYQISVRIQCLTGAVNSEVTAPVIVGNEAGFTESQVQFSYKKIKVYTNFPKRGPMSGGTQLAITGQYLNIGGDSTVYLDDFECKVNETQSTSKRLMCITSKVSKPLTINRIILKIGNSYQLINDTPFVYTPDPNIMEMKPLKSFFSGGRAIAVHGSYFDSIQVPKMGVYDPNSMKEINRTKCIVLNENQMECPSPAINFWFDSLISDNDDTLESLVTVNNYDNHSIKRRKRKRRRRRRRKRTLKKIRSTSSSSSEILARLYRDHLELQIFFIMDHVETVQDLKQFFPNVRSQMTYVSDPKYFPFENFLKLYKGDTLVLEGEKLNAASDDSDVIVTIGSQVCNITSLAANQLVCAPPEKQPKSINEFGIEDDFNLPLVVIHIGSTLKFTVGYIQYELMKSFTVPTEIIAMISFGTIFFVMLFIMILLAYKRKSNQAEREYKRIQIQMDTLESNIRSECKQAFAELQTDMTDLAADLETSGIPILDYSNYIIKVFFPGVTDHPVLIKTDNVSMSCYSTSPKSNYDTAMLQFEKLIYNKFFILKFIETLEAQQTFNIRDKVNVASLIMIVLMPKMDYATDILKSLLLKLIEKSIHTKYPQLMLRRTESVVEKMLTNWMAICMYSYLKKYAGSSLFFLFKALKHQIEKGIVDAVTHDARYSLSEERLIREKIDYSVVTLHVIQDDIDEKFQCKVLDCDTISQVKSKILDVLYKNTPYTMRPSVDELNLEWRHGRAGHLTLQDIDLTTKTINGWKKLNTLTHYGIKESAVMSLVLKNASCNKCKPLSSNMMFNNSTIYFPSINTNSKTMNNDDFDNKNVKIYHLIKMHDDLDYDENEDDHNQQHNHERPLRISKFRTHSRTIERSRKAIPEIFLTRLLSTKGTVQKFIDDFLTTILTVNEFMPLSVKWLFDLLDDAAKKYNITNPEVIHSWKSNSLPLRFWVNFIKNPDFIFDVNKTNTLDSNLSVIAQFFMDSCSLVNHRLGKDSPTNKLLFARDIPHYRQKVINFYSEISKLPKVSDSDINVAMNQLSLHQVKEFDTIAALKELYIYVIDYRDQILENLENDFNCRKACLSLKLEQVSYILDGENISIC